MSADRAALFAHVAELVRVEPPLSANEIARRLGIRRADALAAVRAFRGEPLPEYRPKRGRPAG